MEGLLNAVHVTSRNSNSGILSFSYFRTTEQNRHSFVQFDSQKIEKHLLTSESLQALVDTGNAFEVVLSFHNEEKEMIFL